MRIGNTVDSDVTGPFCPESEIATSVSDTGKATVSCRTVAPPDIDVFRSAVCNHINVTGSSDHSNIPVKATHNGAVQSVDRFRPDWSQIKRRQRVRPLTVTSAASKSSCILERVESQGRVNVICRTKNRIWPRIVQREICQSVAISCNRIKSRVETGGVNSGEQLTSSEIRIVEVTCRREKANLLIDYAGRVPVCMPIKSVTNCCMGAGRISRFQNHFTTCLHENITVVFAKLSNSAVTDLRERIKRLVSSFEILIRSTNDNASASANGCCYGSTQVAHVGSERDVYSSEHIDISIDRSKSSNGSRVSVRR